MIHLTHRMATAAALLFTVSCGDSRAPRTLLAPSATAAAIAMVSGNNQTAKAGEPFAAPLTVRVTDAERNGVGDVAVSFRVTGGAAGLLPKSSGPVAPEAIASIRTESNGVAHMTLIPFEVGAISVTADVSGSQASPVTFTADAAGVVVEFWSPRSFGNYASFVGPCSCPSKFNITTVPIGTSVEWKSLDNESYTVTSISVPPGGVDFDSGLLGPSSRFRFIPRTAGTWEYRDSVSGITATLVAK